MKFQICRASIYDEECPFPGTEELTYTVPRLDGTTATYSAWSIDIQDLDDLLALQNEVDVGLILEWCDEPDLQKQGVVGKLTIYDDYLE